MGDQVDGAGEPGPGIRRRVVSFSEWPRQFTLKPIVSWPGELTRRRKASQFSAGLGDTLALLERELRHLGGRDGILQIALSKDQFRNDGRPRAQAKIAHPGVILTFETRSVGPLSYPCDTYTTWQDNLRAIAKSLEALRSVDRHGVTRHGEQYRGFAALESGKQERPFTDSQSAGAWLMTIAGITDGGEGLSWAVIVRRAQRACHPDYGGSSVVFAKVAEAESYLRRDGLI